VSGAGVKGRGDPGELHTFLAEGSKKRENNPEEQRQKGEPKS